MFRKKMQSQSLLSLSLESMYLELLAGQAVRSLCTSLSVQS